MQPQLQMLKRAVGGPIVLERFLVLPLNIALVWVTCIVLLGWRTGMTTFMILFISLWQHFSVSLSNMSMSVFCNL